MIASRGLFFGRAFKHLVYSTASKVPQQQAKRSMSGSWSYRTTSPEASKATRYTAEGVSAAMWWWVLWHLWHEHEHITGEFDYPDPSAWTNAELGIPPDNYQE